MLIAQWILVALLVANLLLGLYRDINGRPAKEPEGFSGVVGTLIAVALTVILYWYAGAFSLIF